MKAFGCAVTSQKGYLTSVASLVNIHMHYIEPSHNGSPFNTRTTVGRNI